MRVHLDLAFPQCEGKTNKAWWFWTILLGHFKPVVMMLSNWKHTWLKCHHQAKAWLYQELYCFYFDFLACLYDISSCTNSTALFHELEEKFRQLWMLSLRPWRCWPTLNCERQGSHHTFRGKFAGICFDRLEHWLEIQF